jgi:hypothetical protein
MLTRRLPSATPQLPDLGAPSRLGQGHRLSSSSSSLVPPCNPFQHPSFSLQTLIFFRPVPLYHARAPCVSLLSPRLHAPLDSPVRPRRVRSARAVNAPCLFGLLRQHETLRTPRRPAQPEQRSPMALAPNYISPFPPATLFPPTSADHAFWSSRHRERLELPAPARAAADFEVRRQLRAGLLSRPSRLEHRLTTRPLSAEGSPGCSRCDGSAPRARRR